MKRTNRRPVAFVLAATDHGSMLVNRHDYNSMGGVSYGVGYQLLNSSSFDQHEIDISLQLLESRKANFGNGVFAIDCGANIGAHTIEWARLMHGWGDVLAVEAQERIFYALAGNITLNNCLNARALWAAVGATQGTIGVPEPDYLTPSSFGSLELRQRANNEFIGQPIDYSPERLKQTRMMAIDDLALQRLDFMKIDIEGMEMEALQGAQNTIERQRPILLIEKIKSNEQVLQDWLEARGYGVHNLHLNLLAVHSTDPVASQLTFT